MALAIPLTAGTPRRLDTDCPQCGWADLWQVTLHSLTPHGVGTVARLTRCQRCGHRLPPEREAR